jgi:hypothetical protein
MYLIRLSILPFACWLASFSALADESGTLRFVRLDSPNGSNRQPVVWIDQGYPIDLRLNRPLEVPVGVGQHTITIATRFPADPKLFVKRHQEIVYVGAGSFVDLEVTWVANLFAGEHRMKIASVSAPSIQRSISQAAPVQPPGSPNPQPATSGSAQAYVAGFTGKAVRTWPNGSSYEGDFVNGAMHGNGILKLANGDVYQGAFANDVISGQGVFIWANGGQYNGDFVERQMHGRGTMRMADGATYSGDFVNGRWTGTGVLTWPNGHRYSGQFVDGVRTGLGVYEWPDGSRYEGDFANNQRTGNGHYTTRDGRPVDPPSTNRADGAATLLGLFGSFMEGYSGGGSSAPVDFDPPLLRSPSPASIKRLAPASIIPAPSFARQIEATSITQQRYNGAVDKFGNAQLSPQAEPGRIYRGVLDADGSGTLRAYDGSEITIRSR